MVYEISELVYLDHAGAALYSEMQMEAVFRDFTSSVYGNPRILFYLKLSILVAWIKIPLI